MSNNQTVALDREELRAFIADELELPTESITDDAQFASELGVDSLAAMEIIVQLEKKYRVKMSEKELPEITDLNSIYNLISNKLQAA
ncbi:acyl carrier protein [Streptosporangium sp. NPDC000396]|uniref:acyl carrier protein n=1 Tax=Streptosporangium sp. NPDC000396 TaxID=3366185 RepID=UPI0036CC9E36